MDEGRNSGRTRQNHGLSPTKLLDETLNGPVTPEETCQNEHQPYNPELLPRIYDQRVRISIHSYNVKLDFRGESEDLKTLGKILSIL